VLRRTGINGNINVLAMEKTTKGDCLFNADAGKPAQFLTKRVRSCELAGARFISALPPATRNATNAACKQRVVISFSVPQ